MGVARVTDKLKAAMPEKYEPPTTLHVNLKKHGSMNAGDVGKKVHFRGHGIVESIHKDDMGHTMRINVKNLKNAPPTMEDHE